MTTENHSTSIKHNVVPGWFNIAMTVALVWNFFGVLAFIGQMMITPESVSQMSQAEQDLYANTPIWAITAFAVAVFCGLFGCVALMMRKVISIHLLKVSLAGVLIQMFHLFALSNTFEVFGPGGIIMPIMVIVIAIILLWFAKYSTKQGWIT